MSLDITLLALLRKREVYERLSKAVPAQAVDTHTKIILDDYGAYFREFAGVEEIEPGPFGVWFKGFRHPTLKAEAVGVYEAIFRRVSETRVSKAAEDGLMARLVAAGTAADLAALILRFNEGAEVDLYLEMRAAVEKFEQQVDRKVKDPQVVDNIEDLLAAEESKSGFPFALDALNLSIKPAVSGDFFVLAARPDVGKTSWVSQDSTFKAKYVDLMYPGEDRSILWFNNEGPGRRIIVRQYQAALAATIEELSALSHKPATKPGFRHLLHQNYVEAIGGRESALRVFNIHDMWNHEVEDLMRRHRPAGVIFDMVDNIKFGGEVSNNGQRTDQLLEAMYQWARMMGVKHDCWVLATSQVSDAGDGHQYPTLSMLKDSRTGKQGAADVIITIGAVHDAALANSRYLGCTKNKKVPTGGRKSPQVEVLFDGDRCRFISTPT